MAGRGLRIEPIRAGAVRGLPELLTQLNAFPEAVAEGCEHGITVAARNIQARAQMNLPAGSGINPASVDVEIRPGGTTTQATVFVAPGAGKALQGPWALDWPVFVEMGTGPRGIESGGDKYPLPASAYTQQPWTYCDEFGNFHRTSGRAAMPYLWPAYLAEEPYIMGHITMAILAATGGGA